MSSRISTETPAASTGAALGLPDHLGYLLKRARLRFDSLAAPALAAIGLDGRELAVLAVLAAGDALSQHEVAGQLGIDRSTMVSLVDALQSRGLVQRRQAAADRRKNFVLLTADGRDLLSEAQAVRSDVEQRFLSGLSAAEASQLRRLLRVVIDAPPRAAG